MLEIVWKGLFFLSMLVLYANITSITLTFVLVVGFIVCVSGYYYSDRIQRKVDEFLNNCSTDAHFSDPMYSTPVSFYFMNRRYNKMNNNRIPVVGSGELPSPILKNNSLVRSKAYRDKLKMTFSPKDVLNRKNAHGYNPLNVSRRYNTNLDLETFMNVSSPGFTSRVVDKVSESAFGKYSTARQQSHRFDKSSLKQLSKVPRTNSYPVVRIAAPETTNIELISPESNVSDNIESIRSNNILQVLKDMSRKRNYSQEENDRTGSTPKKSKKNEIRNMTPQYKRAHEDCSNDSIEDKNRKKRCDESDNKIAKMMSYTSGMSVLGNEDFKWTNSSKKRKSSRLEKSKNESPEKQEKFRRISGKSIEKEITAKVSEELGENEGEVGESKEAVPETKPVTVKKNQKSVMIDESDCLSDDSSFMDGNSDYVYIAGGKILNRTYCLYRRKLNSSKIDPVSVIGPEPEYVSASSSDDDHLKQNLLNNLMNDIERNGERNDSVIFYQNSITEEIAKTAVTQVEVHQPEMSVYTSSATKPLIPPTTKPNLLQFSSPAPAAILPKPESVVATSHSPFTPPVDEKTNPLASGQSSALTFGMDTVDLAKPSSEPKLHPSSVSQAAVFNSISTPSTNSFAAESVCSTSSVTLNLPPSTIVMSAAKPATTAIQNVTATPGASSAQSTICASTFTPSAPVQPLNSTSTVGFTFATTSKAAENTNQFVSQPQVETKSLAPSVGFTFEGSSKPPSESTNPLLIQSQSMTTQTVNSNLPTLSFGNTSGTSASPTPKIVMFGNTVISTTSSNATQSTNSLFNQGPFSSANSSALNSSSTTPSSLAAAAVPKFPFGQPTAPATAAVSSTFTLDSNSSAGGGGGFKFGQPPQTTAAVTTPSFGAFKTTTTGANLAAPFSATPSLSTSFNFSHRKSENAFAVNAAQQSSTSHPNLFANMANSTPSATAIFGAASNQLSACGNGPTTAVFGGTTAAQTPVFGSTTAAQTPVFGTTNTAAVQPQAQGSVFGGTQPSQSVLFGSTQNAGAGDSTTPNVFSQTANPPNVEVNSSNRTPTFNFGGNQPTPTFGSAAGGFESSTSQPTFGSGATFNFSGTTNAFGGGGSSVPSFGGGSSSPSFGAAGAPQPASNNLFNFGSGTTAPAAPAFQFGVGNPATANAQQNQPFTFGTGAAAPAPAVGGFSIGTGSSGARRIMAKSRRPK